MASTARLGGADSWPGNLVPGFVEATEGAQLAQVVVRTLSAGPDAADAVAQLVVRTLSVASADARVAHVVLRTLSAVLVDARVAQAVVRTLSDLVRPLGVAQVVVRTLSPAPLPPEPEFWSDVIGLLIWIEWSHVDSAGDPLTLVYAKVDLADPAFYYGGWKAARVTQWGAFRRALSDRRGQYELAGLTWTLSDTDRVIRGMLADPEQRFVQNRIVAMRMISDAARRRLERPRLIARAVIRNCRPTAPLLVEFTAEDFLASLFSPMALEKQIPQRTFSLVDFPDMPLANVGRPVPVLYGRLSDERSVEGPPTGLVASETEYGTPITGFSATASNAGGGDCVENPFTPGGTDYVATQVWVTAFDTDGVEYDPQAGAPASVQVTPGYSSIDYAWDAWTPPGGATLAGYRVYYRNYPFDAKCVEVAAGVTAYTLLHFTDGTIVQGGNYAYRVAAMCTDGETVWSEVAIAAVLAKVVPAGVDLTWDIHPHVIGNYVVYRLVHAGPGADANRRWDVVAPTVTFHDDLLDTTATLIAGVAQPSGVVTPIWVGTEAYGPPSIWWYVFALAGHAVSEILNIYQADADGVYQRVPDEDYSTVWCVPGRTYPWGVGSPLPTWPAYADVNGRRYSLIYVRGGAGAAAADGSRPFRVNLVGIEDVGDGTGSPITDLHAQYLHACENWFFQSYQTGDWLASPRWPADVMGAVIRQIDRASFSRVQAIVRHRVPAGYVGAWVLGVGADAETLRDVLAKINLSAGVESGFNRNSQFFVSMLDPDVDLTATVRVRQATDILAGSFEIEDLVEELYNAIPYAYGRNYAAETWQTEGLSEDAASVTNYRERRVDETLELWCVRDAATAADVIAQRLARASEPARMVRCRVPLVGLSIELGDVVTVDHVEGIGPSGWTGQPVRIVRHEFDPDGLTVWLEGYDVARLLAGSGG